MIVLYTSPTPNGHKISCALEHLDIPYRFEIINLREGEQFSTEFSKISLSLAHLLVFQRQKS